MIRKHGVAWSLPLLLVATIAAAQEAPADARPAARIVDGLTIRVGYTAFEHPQTVSSDSTLHSIVRYLQHVSTSSTGEPWRLPVGFEVSIGNYYQVLSWYRRGQIDAAIVSPFIAYLLERDGQALSVLEFTEHCREGGHQPLVGASGEFSTSPWRGYDEYLSRLYDAARVEDIATRAENVDKLARYGRLNFVAHLSSSGFVLPVVYADEWLRRRVQPTPGVDSPEARRFWRLYFDLARFSLHHGVRPPEGTIRDFYFSYSGRAAERRSRDAQTGAFTGWQQYRVGAQPGDDLTDCESRLGFAPAIPNDVLVVRPSIMRELFGRGRIDRTRLAAQLLGSGATTRADASLFASDAGYRGVRWYSEATHRVFRERVDRVFSRTAENQELAARYVRWFENEQFEFTVDETLALLRLDQMNTRSSRLSLVLSGGGVKSLYQTRLLDRLYGLDGDRRPALQNFDPAAVVTLPLTQDAPLTVKSIIGTSGGAMLALFAAQLPPVWASAGTANRLSLTRLLSETTAGTLFPPADIPRVVTVVVVLALLFLTLALARVVVPPLRAHAHSTALTKDCPWWILAIELALVVGGAVVIVSTRNPELQTARGVEGTLYALLVLMAHIGVSCIGKRRGADPADRDSMLARLSMTGLAFGVTMVGLGYGVFRLTDLTDSVQPAVAAPAAPLLGIIGLCLVAAALISGAGAGMGGLYLPRQRLSAYGQAMAVVAVVMLATYTIVLLGVARGDTTMLELTPSFWLWLLVGAVAVSVTMVVIATFARGTVARFLQVGVYELMRDRQGAVTTTLASSVTVIGALALVCWVLMVAPSIYGSDYARRALTDTQARFSRDHPVGVFNSNLIVTGSLLQDRYCPVLRGPVRAGDLYFCFGGPGGCGTSRDGAWQPVDMPHPSRALDAVFASGSPFPVLSAHRTRLRNGCVVPLVDGGYVHNIPLEAASLADSRQVLVLNASPGELDAGTGAPGDDAAGDRRPVSGWTSQLVQFGSRIIGFMFARAQELDRSIAANMVVASLSPAPENGRWASLLDFTDSTRNWMISEAERDLARNRRIGRIDSWGFPLVAGRMGPDDAPITARGWTPRVAGVLRETSQRIRPGAVVALDMDNTILRGDIGDATFLKMVVDLQYAGDRNEFWELFPNQRAAAQLRTYWIKFTATGAGLPSARYLNPEIWPSEFADYVVLFLRQYEELYNQPGGAMRAYAWVVQLMDGLPRESLSAMFGDLWKTEMNRPMTPLRIRSAKYGEVEIQGGVRVHQEMATLIDELHGRGAHVWIVTASAEWIGQHVAERLRIPRERVIGYRLRPAGVYGEMDLPLTYGAGKQIALQRRGLRPLLAVGDSGGDVDMLRTAGTAVVIDRGRIDATDIRQNGWLTQPIELLRTTTR